jgi:hypothetical protein
MPVGDNTGASDQALFARDNHYLPTSQSAQDFRLLPVHIAALYAPLTRAPVVDDKNILARCVCQDRIIGDKDGVWGEDSLAGDIRLHSRLE